MAPTRWRRPRTPWRCSPTPRSLSCSPARCAHRTCPVRTRRPTSPPQWRRHCTGAWRRTAGRTTEGEIMTTAAPARDFVGYGENPPDFTWPNGARLALNVVVNYEEGAERNVLDGDTAREVLV